MAVRVVTSGVDRSEPWVQAEDCGFFRSLLLLLPFLTPFVSENWRQVGRRVRERSNRSVTRRLGISEGRNCWRRQAISEQGFRLLTRWSGNRISQPFGGSHAGSNANLSKPFYTQMGIIAMWAMGPPVMSSPASQGVTAPTLSAALVPKDFRQFSSGRRHLRPQLMHNISSQWLSRPTHLVVNRSKVLTSDLHTQ